MRFFILSLTLSALMFADFTLLYKLDNNFTQEVNYKTPNHVLFTFKEGNKTFEKLLIDNNNKYLSLFERGIETIYQIDDTIITPANNTEKAFQPDFKILKKESNITYKGYPAEKWLIEDNGIKQNVIVSNQPDLVIAIFHTIEALKKLLPQEKQKDAHIFDMGNGYILLSKESLDFLEYNSNPLNLSLFSIEKKFTQEEQKEFSKEIKKCFLSPCCGQKHSRSKTITRWLHHKVNQWILTETAKCENINPTSGLESALYKENNNTIVVEMTTGDSNTYGKIVSLQEQGIEIDNILSIKVNGFQALTAYLPFIDSTIIDITLPNTTFSIYQKGKTNLLPFAQKAIKFSKISRY